MKNFDDLKFTYDESMMRWMASLTLDNGYSFSVIAGNDDGAFQPFYGRYPDTFEVAVFNSDGNFVPLSVSFPKSKKNTNNRRATSFDLLSSGHHVSFSCFFRRNAVILWRFEGR